MSTILNHTGYIILKICLFSRSPVDLPYSKVWLLLFATAMVVLKASFLQNVPGLDLVQTLQITLAILVLFGLGLFLLLKVNQKQNRWLKIFMALLGTELLILLLFLPINLLFAQPQVALGLAAFRGIWIYGVGGYILHKGMEIKMLSGVLWVFALNFISEIPLFLILSELLAKA